MEAYVRITQSNMMKCRLEMRFDRFPLFEIRYGTSFNGSRVVNSSLNPNFKTEVAYLHIYDTNEMP